jgi:hypothetical protein
MPEIMLPISSLGAPVLAGPDLRSVCTWPPPPVRTFRAADQDARVDAEGVADKTEHYDGADAESAAAHREAKAAATAHSAAAVIAPVIDIVAAAKIIVTHGGISSSRLIAQKYLTRQSRKISIPLINNPPGKYCLVRKGPQIRSAISACD